MAKCEVVVELGSATWVTMVLFSILFLVLKKCICICVHTHTHTCTPMRTWNSFAELASTL